MQQESSSRVVGGLTRSTRRSSHRSARSALGVHASGVRSTPEMSHPALPAGNSSSPSSTRLLHSLSRSNSGSQGGGAGIGVGGTPHSCQQAGDAPIATERVAAASAIEEMAQVRAPRWGGVRGAQAVSRSDFAIAACWSGFSAGRMTVSCERPTSGVPVIPRPIPQGRDLLRDREIPCNCWATSCQQALSWLCRDSRTPTPTFRAPERFIGMARFCAPNTNCFSLGEIHTHRENSRTPRRCSVLFKQCFKSGNPQATA